MTIENDYQLTGILIKSLSELDYEGEDGSKNPDRILVEAIVVINCQGHQITCFVIDGFGNYTLTSKWIHERYGKNVNFKLSLCGSEPVKTNNQILFIKELPNSRGGTLPHHNIGGKVISVIPSRGEPHTRGSNDRIIVDCGLPIETDAISGKFNIGDYLQVNGRLDIINIVLFNPKS